MLLKSLFSNAFRKRLRETVQRREWEMLENTTFLMGFWITVFGFGRLCFSAMQEMLVLQGVGKGSVISCFFGNRCRRWSCKRKPLPCYMRSCALTKSTTTTTTATTLQLQHCYYNATTTASTPQAQLQHTNNRRGSSIIRPRVPTKYPQRPSAPHGG